MAAQSFVRTTIQRAIETLEQLKPHEPIVVSIVSDLDGLAGWADRATVPAEALALLKQFPREASIDFLWGKRLTVDAG